ncbi:poly(ADP-ribose) glycohydrolase domain-containing protein [Streptomyces maoxianensis]|uniref:Poly(ADP-ribose) glycohydrolase domain-containing protein n=1 Tax=Streptomyces maoxianensis TaxID=1459942 RepID=A0ABV9GHW0_9ACTN
MWARTVRRSWRSRARAARRPPAGSPPPTRDRSPLADFAAARNPGGAWLNGAQARQEARCRGRGGSGGAGACAGGPGDGGRARHTRPPRAGRLRGS